MLRHIFRSSNGAEWTGNWRELIDTSRARLPHTLEQSIVDIARMVLCKDFGNDPNKIYTERDREKLIRKIQKAERQYEKAKAGIIRDHLERTSH